MDWLKDVTEDQYLQAIHDAVAERGENWVYPFGKEGWRIGDSENSCRYVRSDKPEPACIVGEVLHRVGVPLGDLSQHEGRAASVTLPTLGMPGSMKAVLDALDDAQTSQDLGSSWGQALVRFNETYHSRKETTS